MAVMSLKDFKDNLEPLILHLSTAREAVDRNGAVWEHFSHKQLSKALGEILALKTYLD